MQILTHNDKDWVDLEDEKVDEATRKEFDGRLRQLLATEHLLVLAGLGTSLAITGTHGQALAPSMEDLWQGAERHTGGERWQAALAAAGWRSEFADDIELLLSRCQMALALSGDDTLQEFVADCERVIVDACRFIDADANLSAHEVFLRRVARRPTRLPRARLFTTNYDLAFETAASNTGFALIDGFSHTAPQRFDSVYFGVDLAIRKGIKGIVDWMPNVLQLLKLHGSVDWQQAGNGVIRAPTPERPLIIYPQATKFEASYRQPFLEFMARFQSALRVPDTGVFVIGSGWRDQHLTEPMLAAVRSNVRLSMVVVAPGIADGGNPNVNTLAALIRRGDRRLTLIDGTFEELVISLPELVPETETEQHNVRIDANG